MNPILIAVIAGVLGLGVAVFMASYVLKQDQGSKKVAEVVAEFTETIKRLGLSPFGRRQQ